MEDARRNIKSWATKHGKEDVALGMRRKEGMGTAGCPILWAMTRSARRRQEAVRRRQKEAEQFYVPHQIHPFLFRSAANHPLPSSALDDGQTQHITLTLYISLLDILI